MAVALLSVVAVTAAAFAIWSFAKRPSPKLDLPYVCFDGDNSPSRYRAGYAELLSRGYNKYTKNDQPFCIRNPNDPKRPMIILPFKYLEEVKWVPESRMSFWRHLDTQSILTQIGGPGITDEVARAGRIGMNKGLVHLIERLQEACLASFKKEMPPCQDWTSIQPYQLILRVFASMSACVVVGPELGGLDSEWQTLSMSYVAAALSAPGQVKQTYPPWLYWLSQYIHPGIRSMWRYRRRAGELLAPVLGTRRAAVERELKEGRRKTGGPREYEDCVQWLLDAHSSYGKTLMPDQLVQDLFVIMTASIHTTSGTALCILFDLIDHPEAVDEIREEIVRVQAAHPVWTRQALGELRVLDSFMRESSRMHALTQYTAVQRVITTGPWVFKDGLVIPTDHEVAFPSYHHNMDPDMHPDAGKFDAHRHLRKRTGPDVHKFHFASVGEDLIGFGAGRHACPGRFFAQETIKLMFVHLLMGYDCQHTDEGLKGPLYLPNNLFIVPNPALPVLVKARAREVTVV